MSSRGHCRSTVSPSKSSFVDLESLFYLSGKGNFDGHGYQLCQEAAVKGHHEHHRVVVGENKCDLQAQ